MMMSIETEHAGVHVNRGCVVLAFTEIVTAPVHGTTAAGSSGDSLHPSAMTALNAMPNPSPPTGTADASLMHSSNSGTVLDRNQAVRLLDRTQP
jgi:hypothetical protein